MFELINLIQIKKAWSIFFCRIHIFSATLLVCSQAEKTSDIMGSIPVFTLEWVSPTDLSCSPDSLQNKHRRAQTICWISDKTKLSSIYRHELIVIYILCVDETSSVAPNSGETQTVKLAIKLIIFSLFGRDTIWRIPRKRVAREGNFEVLKRCYIKLYPTIVFLLC